MSFLQVVTARARRALGVVAAFSVLALGPAAPAQSGDGFGEVFQKDFSRRDLPIIANSLKLDEAQRAIVEALFEQYDDSIEAGIEDLKNRWIGQRELLEKATPEQVSRIIFGAVEDWAKKRKQLKEQLIADIRDQALTDEQQALWPAVERRLTRVKALPKGRLSGENIDLFVIAEQLGIETSSFSGEPVGMMLEQYDVALDQAIKRRDAAIDASRSVRSQVMQNPDASAYMRTVDDLLEARVALRKVNDDYSTLVASALPAELGEKFLKAVREKAYPRVYRPTQMHRMFDAAREIEGLEPPVLASITELERNYDAELTTLNEAMVTAIRQSDAQQERGNAERQMSRLAGNKAARPEDPTRDEFRRRGELDQKYMDLLKALLTPQQWETLPGATEAGDRAVPSGDGVNPGAGFSGPGRTPGNADGTRRGNHVPPGADSMKGRRE